MNKLTVLVASAFLAITANVAVAAEPAKTSTTAQKSGDVAASSPASAPAPAPKKKEKKGGC
jgi:hypothetical protein